MPDPHDLEVSRNMLMWGKEILPGALLVHDPDFLTARAKEHEADISKIKASSSARSVWELPNKTVGLTCALEYYKQLEWEGACNCRSRKRAEHVSRSSKCCLL